MRSYVSRMSALLVLLFSVGTTAFCEESIQHLDVDIKIEKSGDIYITENYLVDAEGIEIKHGIYRDFPTDYHDTQGKPVHTGFSVLKVLRDGTVEPYHTERESNGTRVYIGKKDAYVSPGMHSYQLAFSTDRQVTFFSDHDEFYFNAIGTGWEFPIEHSKVTVHLPETTAGLTTAAYTGRQGERGSNVRIQELPNGAVFTLTRPLHAHEGMTIVLSFPKGLIDPPTALQNFFFFIRDFFFTILVIGLTLALLSWFYLEWAAVGQDKRDAPIVPQFGPPKDLSPAAARYISRMGFDDTVFSAAIVSLAVKKKLTIHNEGGQYSLTFDTAATTENLSPEEAAVLDNLRSAGESPLQVKQSNYEVLQLAKNNLKSALSTAYERTLFLPHRGYAAIGVLFLLVEVGVGIAAFKETSSMIFSSSYGMLIRFLPFLCIVLVNISYLVFARYIAAPTEAGRPVQDALEGFKMYLGTAERERFAALNPPKEDLQLFETFFPYALAFGVANVWSELFRDQIERTLALDPQRRDSYWYQGNAYSSSSFSGFASSFSSTIASSSVSPSSSGSGGSSGGGGGGGGGGGW